MNLGGIICWLLRGHKWRRLRKHEMSGLTEVRHNSMWMPVSDPCSVRQCTRCGATRLAKQRTRRTQGREAT